MDKGNENSSVKVATERAGRDGILRTARHTAGGVLRAMGLERSVLRGLARLEMSVGRAPSFDMHFGLLEQLRRLRTGSDGELKRARYGDRDGPTILFASMRGAPYLMAFETMLAYRLMSEGARPVFLTCENLPHCNNRSRDMPTPKDICGKCLRRSEEIFDAAGLPLSKLSDFIGPEVWEKAPELTGGLTVDECFHYSYEGVPLGALCEVSVTRYLCQDAILAGERFAPVWRDFLTGAIVLCEAYKEVYNRIRPDILVVNNGRFFWFGIALHMARERGIKIVSYEGMGERSPSHGQTWYFRGGSAAASWWTHGRSCFSSSMVACTARPEASTSRTPMARAGGASSSATISVRCMSCALANGRG